MLYRLRVNDFILKLSSFFINIGHPYTFVIFRGVHITEFLVTFFFPFYFILRGITLVDEVHEFVEKIMGRPVWTHEFPFIAEELKEKVKPMFLEICGNLTEGEDI